jgi:hypothetical protein
VDAMPRKPKVIVTEPTSTCKQCASGWYHAGKWFCRLNPPTVYYDPEEQGPCSAFPVVAADLTCSKFTPILNS